MAIYTNVCVKIVKNARIFLPERTVIRYNKNRYHKKQDAVFRKRAAEGMKIFHTVFSSQNTVNLGQ